MQQYNAEKDFVTARKVNAMLNSYDDAIARINARFAAAKAAKSRDSANGSTPSSPEFSAASDSTAQSSAPEDAPIELTQSIEEDVKVTIESTADTRAADSPSQLEHDAPVIITFEHYQVYLDMSRTSGIDSRSGFKTNLLPHPRSQQKTRTSGRRRNSMLQKRITKTVKITYLLHFMKRSSSVLRKRRKMGSS